MLQLYGLLLLLLHSACAQITVYYTGGTTLPVTTPTVTSLAPNATWTGLLAYDPLVIAAPAIPTGFATQPNIQLSSTTPLGVSISQMSSFFGFSIEMSVAGQVLGAGSKQINVPFLNLMANLVKRSGRVNIRVGGNSQETAVMVQNTTTGKLIVKDNSTTQGTTQTPPIVFKEDLLYMMANISAFTNVRWFLGIPFNQTNPYRLDIVQAGQPILGDYLLGLQAGNEPDFYQQFGKRPAPYTPQSYFNDVGTLVNQMNSDSSILNRSMLIGPSVSSGPWTPEQVWDTGYVQAYSQYLAYLAVEHYPTDNCGARYNTAPPTPPETAILRFISHSEVTGLAGPYINSSNIAQTNGKPFLMFETNTASCGGFAGVSDAFVASLWSLDWAMQMAYSNFSMGLFHTGGQNDSYNPFTPPPGKMASYSQWTVGPVYYSALAMAETLGNGSQVLDISAASNLSDQSAAYAVYENNQAVRIGVINYVTDPSGASDIQFTFSIGGSNLGQSNAIPSQVQVKYLLANSTTQKYNFTWAGQTFGSYYESDGRPIGSESIQTVQCNQGANTCTVSVPAPSYTLIFLTSNALQEVDSGPSKTFSTTVTTKRSYMTVNQAVLATSNGHSGSSLDEVASTSKNSLNGAFGVAQALEGAVMFGCIAFGVLTLFRGAMWW